MEDQDASLLSLSVVDPAYVLHAARQFLTVTQQSTKATPPKPDGDQEEGESQEDGWEASGCLLWDIAAIPEQAHLLMAHQILDILQTLIQYSVAHEQWRALEVSLGILGNLACHSDLRQGLLAASPLAELVLERALWVDDTPALCEACRLLSGLCLSTKREDRWWQLMLQPEGLGRIAYLIDNTLSPLLLEKALSLGCAMLQAAGDQLPALTASLLELDILTSAGSILSSYLDRLEREQREFDGGGSSDGNGEQRPASASPPAPQRQPGEQQLLPSQQQVQQGGAAAAAAAAQGAAGDSGAQGSVATSPACDPAAAAQAAGPEISEAIVIEALSLVDGLTACDEGSAAVGQAAGLVGTVLRLLAASESEPLRLVCATLLAPLEGVGQQLAARPEAVRAVLEVLAAVQSKAAGAAGSMEAEAAWALLSAALHAVAAKQAGADAGATAAEGAEGGEGRPEASGSAAGGSGAASVRELVLQAVLDFAGVVLGDWEPSTAAVQQQQQYCLQQLQLLLGQVGMGGQGQLEGAAAFLQQLEGRLAQPPGQG